ncbi:MAG: SpoIID/LytB domain-containing protein [Chloroflexi bacterium]|nr:SpoIID/LytB domain-containing protein [Chloroflexota bacterium]
MRAPVRRASLSPATLGAAVMAAVLLLVLTSAVAVGATTMAPRCDYVRVRTGPSTTYAIKATLMQTSRVSVVATVSGGSYGTSCGGWVSGSKWYRINAVNGHSTSSLYGVSYVYGASGLFKAVTTVAATASPAASPSATPLASATAPPASSAPASAAPSTAPSMAPSPTVAPSASVTPTPSPTPVPTPAPTSGPWETAPTALGDAITFYGRGYGHGVGMSQYGAYGRAVAGQTAATIVGHYYPGTTLGTATLSTVRVLILQSYAATASSPLRIYGRVGTWKVDGISAIFPVDAQLRMYPDAAAASGWHLTVIGADASTLWNGAAPASSFYVRPADSLALLQLYSKPTSYDRFRGNLRVIGSSSGTVSVVNWLGMESYLLGVVPVEMSSSWPAEALRSQAIAARSYAGYRLHPTSGTFDLYDDTRSQVYRGQLGEKTAGTSAVNATAGKLLLYNGAIANALYHSGDGGWTENNEYVFVSASGAITSGALTYLRGSSDRAPDGSSYDKASPFNTWHTTIYSLAQIQAVFAADSRTNVGQVVALDLSHRGVSGRLISVTLIGANGTTKTVSGAVFVAVFNANTPATDPAMRNTLFDLAPIP